MSAAVTDPVRTGRGPFHDVRVARVDRLCDDAVAITFDIAPELADAFRFRPGQSVTLRRAVDGREERRSYSICAAAGRPLRIGVREVPGGLVSRWLVHDVRVGDLVEMQAPSGTFSPELGRSASHGLIAAGSGITPTLSIAASLAADPNSDVVLLYGNRRSDTVMFADEVADLKDGNPGRVQLVHVLSREPQEVELFNGRMDAAKLRELLPAVCAPQSIDHWWLCGPFGMVTDAAAVLSELGVDPKAIHRELFYVEEVAPPPARHVDAAVGPGCEVTVILDGRATTTTVATGSTVLDGAQRVRPDLPFACKGGVCGTCRAKVVFGQVSMRRNFALEDDEVADGFVLTCQAMPETDAVTVDYDA
ncbi:MAG TPA: 1,2-phenylacetyl-CoA epoxidase subunit PaaE [Jatrophihabitantaceae bacterium]|nr:1,2-phenylacetyl-CoA epoxidase subunit PaaE [Jatrophihabitantaceae bacterium]